VLLGDGKGGFKPMQGPPLILRGCHGPDSVTAGDLEGDGRQDIVVACAQSKKLLIFEPDGDGHFVLSDQSSKGGWGAVVFANLTHGHRGELITANNDDGTITILFPD
jgi:hypothetical protein